MYKVKRVAASRCMMPRTHTNSTELCINCRYVLDVKASSTNPCDRSAILLLLLFIHRSPARCITAATSLHHPEYVKGLAHQLDKDINIKDMWSAVVIDIKHVSHNDDSLWTGYLLSKTLIV